ncbi:MAG: hypothetical protein EP299_11340 [Acidobacteria bacterium]|nr:MAG: hypothetical protein EP299_11340 [Acidobacteriota bacterium]
MVSVRQVRACLEREEEKMNDQHEPSSPVQESEASSTNEDFGHPRGTLAIVLIYGVLFVLIWAGLWVFQFLGRGVPQP